MHKSAGYIGPGDDAAYIRSVGVITVDSLIEGVHWDQQLSAEDVGYKTVAVSVSDLAAMGARPQWAVLSLAIARPVKHRWVQDFARGLQRANQKWGVSLIGGDTTRSPGPTMISLTLGGQPVARPIKRSDGQADDLIWVSGTLGLPAAAYHLRSNDAQALSALRRPDPPLNFALDLSERGLLHACMDLSDGLRLDLHRLCAASSLGAIVHAEELPIAHSLRAHPMAVQLAVGGGEDYQLLFTSAPQHAAQVRACAQQHNVQCTVIGRLTHAKAVVLNTGAWPPPLFSHFNHTDAS